MSCPIVYASSTDSTPSSSNSLSSSFAQKHSSISRHGPTTLDVPGLTRSKTSPNGTISSSDIGSKLVIVMVGLPARGKSYITKKLTRYLNWLQHDTRIFNVGNTRRKSKSNLGPAHEPLSDDFISIQPHDHYHEHDDVDDVLTITDNVNSHEHEQEHDASFFNADNSEAASLRETWAMETLDELLDYVLDGPGSVGIFDATNTTKKRRKRAMERIRNRSNGQLKVLFLESICNKSSILEENIRLKLSGPDYKKMNKNLAIKDFIDRMKNYEKVYETIDDDEADNYEDESFQYVKMINVGRKVVSYNIHGFLSGQAVSFLFNFNLTERQLWITRHGESEDNEEGRIGGDAHLSLKGQKYSKDLAIFMNYKQLEFRKKQLNNFSFKNERILSRNGSHPSTPLSEPKEGNFCVWTSMLNRTIETAKYFDDEKYFIKEMRMLNELSAGICEGLTYNEIKERYPEEYKARQLDKLRYRYPGIGGESYLDVINRLKPIIVELERMEDNILLIGHQVVTRVLLAYFMNLDRSMISELIVPLHSVFVLEPKPYGVEWAVYKWDEETGWFYHVPHDFPTNGFSKPIQPIDHDITHEFSNDMSYIKFPSSASSQQNLTLPNVLNKRLMKSALLNANGNSNGNGNGLGFGNNTTNSSSTSSGTSLLTAAFKHSNTNTNSYQSTNTSSTSINSPNRISSNKNHFIIPTSPNLNASHENENDHLSASLTSKLNELNISQN